jgi:DNA-binding NtrC family response regulator
MSIELTTSTYGSRRPSILIVDDEPHVCTLLARWLASEGMDCVVAGSTSEAIAVLETTVFDLVAADVIMPGGSGLTLLERAKAIVPDVAVLMLTASGDTQVAIDASQAGAPGRVCLPSSAGAGAPATTP